MNKNISSEFLQKNFNEALDNIKNNNFIEALSKFKNLDSYKKNDSEILSLISFLLYQKKIFLLSLYQY